MFARVEDDSRVRDFRQVLAEPLEVLEVVLADIRTGLHLNAQQVPGVSFRPIYLKPFYSMMQGEQIQGIQVHVVDYDKAPLTDIQFLVAQEIARLYPSHSLAEGADPSRFGMFDHVCGSKQIRHIFTQRNQWADAKGYWYKDVEPFRQLSRKYHLYK